MKLLAIAMALAAVSLSSLRAECELIDNPPKGFLHLRDTKSTSSVDHFICLDHVIAVSVHEQDLGKPFRVSIATTGTRYISGADAGGSASQSYSLYYSTREEADAAAERLIGLIASGE